MDAIILAAGYAIRLHPLTENTPKPLLKIAGKPIIEHILNKLEEIDKIRKIYIITNDKFYQHFLQWLHSYDAAKPVEIINDKSKSNDDRLGALGDVNFAIDSKGLSDDIAVVAGDNLFELSFADVVNFFSKLKSNVVVLHDVKDAELAKHYGIVEINESKIITNFEEKPIAPRSTLASTGIYLFPGKTIFLIKKYIEQGNNPDKTGNFIEWLHKRDIVYSFVTDKKWYDIGSFEQLKIADEHYRPE